MAVSTLTKSLEIPMLESEGVAEFLSEHGIPRSLLCEIANRLRDHFPDCPISLQMSYDPEGTHFHQLAMLAHTPDDPRTALNKLHEFDRTWWSSNEDRARYRVIVDVAPL